MENVSEFISKYGFPVVAAFGMSGLIYYVWIWVTKEVNPVISETKNTLIGLVDRVRMLDNDLIRLNEKVDVTIKLRRQDKNKGPEGPLDQ